MDSELYTAWFRGIFLKYANPARPLLLFQDGHGSHITPELIDCAKENQVEILCLPPHTTHVFQPLDKVLYGPLKTAYSKTITNLCFARRDFIVSKNDFLRIVRAPIEQVFRREVIVKSFKCTGICPLDKGAVDTSQLYPSGVKKQTDDSITPPCSSRYPSRSRNTDDSNPSLPDPVTPSNSTAGSSSDSSLSTPSSSSQTPCPTCGNTPSPENPLVAAGLIPPHLRDILLCPEQDKLKKKKKTRVIIKS